MYQLIITITINMQLSSTSLSRGKLTLYTTLIIPALIYGAKSWTLSAADEKCLDTFERKIRRKIFGPICVNVEYRRRINHELYDDVELGRRVKI